MKKLFTPTLFAALLFTAALNVRAQTPRPKTQPPPPKELTVIAPVSVPVDQGRLQDGVYTSDYFGFSFTVKPGWVAMDAATRKAVMESGKAVVQNGAAEQKKAQIDAAMSRTAVLINVSKFDVNAPNAEFNAMLMCLAERVPTAIIKTGEDYLKASMLAFEGTAAKIEMVGVTRAEKLGGVPFTVADMKFTAGPRVIMQRYYVRIANEHVLAFIYSYVDEVDLKIADEMLKTVRFK
ncbi:MAG TPA: hypothetical protein VGB98_02770 [Pyrinomonadaceae bacterium]|jgi:hypothetical protein